MYFAYHSSTAVVTDDTNYGDTLEIRYKLWKGTVGLLKEHPLFGAGLNGFKEVYGAEYRLSALQEEFQYPHNIILNFWSETGLLGLLTFIYLMFLIFKNFLQTYLKSSQKIFGLGLCAGFCYLIIHGLVDVPYFKNDLSLQFFGLLALFELWLSQEIA
jgi:putative inorganic carbon (HCO3(-)) transporter